MNPNPTRFFSECSAFNDRCTTFLKRDVASMSPGSKHAILLVDTSGSMKDKVDIFLPLVASVLEGSNIDTTKEKIVIPNPQGKTALISTILQAQKSMPENDLTGKEVWVISDGIENIFKGILPIGTDSSGETIFSEPMDYTKYKKEYIPAYIHEKYTPEQNMRHTEVLKLFLENSNAVFLMIGVGDDCSDLLESMQSMKRVFVSHVRERATVPVLRELVQVMRSETRRNAQFKVGIYKVSETRLTCNKVESSQELQQIEQIVGHLAVAGQDKKKFKVNPVRTKETLMVCFDKALNMLPESLKPYELIFKGFLVKILQIMIAQPKEELAIMIVTKKQGGMFDLFLKNESFDGAQIKAFKTTLNSVFSMFKNEKNELGVVTSTPKIEENYMITVEGKSLSVHKDSAKYKCLYPSDILEALAKDGTYCTIPTV